MIPPGYLTAVNSGDGERVHLCFWTLNRVSPMLVLYPSDLC